MSSTDQTIISSYRKSKNNNYNDFYVDYMPENDVNKVQVEYTDEDEEDDEEREISSMIHKSRLKLAERHSRSAHANLSQIVIFSKLNFYKIISFN